MRDAAYYREKAAHLRELASDGAAGSADLIRLAGDYEEMARRLDPDAEPVMPSPE